MRALLNGGDVAPPKPLSQFLRMAVMAGVERAVHIHIERGDDLNACDASGMTPLMLSAARNRAAVCKLLLDAGADHSLLDPSGKTALEIAIGAGSDATAAILLAVHSPTCRCPPCEAALDQEPAPAAHAPWPAGPTAGVASAVKPEAATAVTEFEKRPESMAHETAPPSEAMVSHMDESELDLSGWEAEEEPTRPDADLVVLDSAIAVQLAITAHEPIDSSSEWDDIEAYLPETALPLARADDAEGRARLRSLLLRAIREGSVPALDVQAQSSNEDGSANPEAESYLTMVINDLGAEVDERYEYSGADENFEVFVDTEETPYEEATLDEALVAIDRAASPRYEPLRIYQREFQSMQLLTAREEIQLAKEMEAALDAALDALATWPDGVARTLAAAAAAIAGTRQLSSVWVGGEPDPDLASRGSSEAGAPAQVESEDSMEDDGEFANEARAHAGNGPFAEAVRRLATLVEREDGPRTPWQEIRQALAGLRLNRRFLLELIDAASGSTPCSGFQRAMADFRKARDWMAAANLKLAFFHAKKYLHSGEPLDDLAQEGNIGLLIAVDRYDWRRGFRFSTYATWWIRQQISRHVACKVRTIRMPVHIHEKLQHADRMIQAFEKAVGHEPTLDELAERMQMPRHKLAGLLRLAPEPSPIDQPTIDGMIAIEARDSYASPDPADVVDKIQLTRAVDHYISSLSTKDRKEEQILRLRFGIGVDEGLTLDEIGTRFGVTRERIRQIEATALRKLRHPARTEPLARLVLGLTPRENPPASSAQEPPGDDGPDSTEAAAPREPMEPAGASKPTALDRVLAQAAELCVSVEDEDSGRVWVRLLTTLDGAHRGLARKLIELGFEHSPGKGYWK